MHLLQQLPENAAAILWQACRLGIWLILLTVLFVPLERCFPRNKQPVVRKNLAQDVFFYFLNNLVPKLVLIVPLTICAKLVHHYLPSAWYETVAHSPFWLRGAAGMLVGEIGAYWGHRWSHEIPFLWRFHAVHHQAEEMDWLVHTRAHPADIVFTRLCALVPMYLLGLAQPAAREVDLVPMVATIVATVWGFLIHANVNWRLGKLESWIASPAFHHWHHTNDGPQLINKNYAPMLPWIDRWFGTHYLPATWPTSYGVLPDTSPAAAAESGAERPPNLESALP